MKLNRLNPLNSIDEFNINDTFTLPEYELKYDKINNDIIIGKGNCLDFMLSLETSSIDLILTDPPYNIGNFMHDRNTNLVKMRENQFAYAGWDNLSTDKWEKEMDSFFEQSSRILKNSGALLMFMSLIKIETIIKLATKYNFYYKTTGIWHKTNPMPRNMNIHFVNSTEAWLYFINDDTSGTFNNNGKMAHDFYETSITSAKEKKYGKHPTQKPEELITHFIKHLSNKNEVVLDPFMGSGTTGVCSKKLNRKFIGFELSDEYYQISKERILNQ